MLACPTSSGQDAGWVGEVNFTAGPGALVIGETPVTPKEGGSSNKSALAPATPRLSITSHGNEVRLSWPLSAAGWVIEETLTADGAAPVWIALSPATCQTNATHYSIIVPSFSTTRCYRLHKQ